MDFSTLSLSDLIAVEISTLSSEDLAAYKGELASRFASTKAAVTGVPTKAQRAEVLSIRDRYAEVVAAIAEAEQNEEVSEDEAAEFADLDLEEASDDAAEDDTDAEGDDEGEDEGTEEASVEDVEDEPEVEAAVETKPAKKFAAATAKPRATKQTARIALAGQRPEVHNVTMPEDMLSITAAADNGLPTGGSVSLSQVDTAWYEKAKRFPRPQGDGSTEDIRSFSLAAVQYDQAPEFQIDESMSTKAIHDVFEAATTESRLEGNSLVASAGWCAPSEIMYDLPGQEVVDGMYSAPEVQVNRGGFKHTTGISWATLTGGVGFTQTESQAISGTSKASYEIPCPSFTEARLDAIGVNLRVPILLESGYPEVVSNVTARALLVHQVRINAYKLAAVNTLAGSARNFSVDLGSSMADTLSGVNLVLVGLRQKYRLGENATLEVIFPTWAKEVFREDLSNRTGRDPSAVSDSEILAHFAARKAAVQFVYDWSDLADVTALAWPASLNFMAYPAGTIITGAANVINLSSIYDAASLATNIYTGLFAEQGILVEKMNYEVIKGVIPTCQAGRTGAADLTCS